MKNEMKMRRDNKKASVARDIRWRDVKINQHWIGDWLSEHQRETGARDACFRVTSVKIIKMSPHKNVFIYYLNVIWEELARLLAVSSRFWGCLSLFFLPRQARETARVSELWFFAALTRLEGTASVTLPRRSLFVCLLSYSVSSR